MTNKTNKHIMVVEDEKLMARALVDALEGEGYKVTQESSGEDIVETITELAPDMIILDIMLPGKTGNFILEELRFEGKAKDTPVLVLSNISEVDDIEDRATNEPDITCYLLKANTTMEQIVAKVNQQLETA